MIGPEAVDATSPACEMVAEHQGMILGYANARILGACPCEAKDFSLCHEGMD